MEVADFAKTFAESVVQRPIARGVVGSIRTCGTSALLPVAISHKKENH